MKAVCTSDPPLSTFVVRLWYEGTAEGPRWRGRIEHLQSGESAAFLEPDGLLSFLRRFGVGADDSGKLTRAEQRTTGRIGTAESTTENRRAFL